MHPWSKDRKFGVNKKRPGKGLFLLKRHRAIFPGLEDPSIVTAERLNCCVRYGNRCDPLAMGTEAATPNETNLTVFLIAPRNGINPFRGLLFSLVRGKSRPITMSKLCYKSTDKLEKIKAIVLDKHCYRYDKTTPITSQCTFISYETNSKKRANLSSSPNWEKSSPRRRLNRRPAR